METALVPADQEQREAATILQAAFRGNEAKKVVAHKKNAARAKEQGKLAALPGTVEGESGWYHMGAGDDVFEFEVAADGQWTQKGAPITLQEWRKDNRLPTPKSPRMSKNVVAHKKKAARAKEQGKLAALPGTVEGESGWYHTGDHVYEFNVGADGQWSQNGAPITLQEWRKDHPQSTPTSPSIRRISKKLLSHKKKAARAKEQGKLAALPGTVEGESGWYHTGDHVFKFNVGADGQWSQNGAPITLQEWHADQKRKKLKKALKEKSRPQPMPGTTLGEAGWYQIYDHVYEFGLGPGGEWEQQGAPLTMEEWRKKKRNSVQVMVINHEGEEPRATKKSKKKPKKKASTSRPSTADYGKPGGRPGTSGGTSGGRPATADFEAVTTKLQLKVYDDDGHDFEQSLKAPSPVKEKLVHPYGGEWHWPVYSSFAAASEGASQAAAEQQRKESAKETAPTVPETVESIKAQDTTEIVGEAYPDFTIQNAGSLNTDRISTHVDNGLPSILCFYATWCQTTREHVAKMEECAEIFAGRANLVLVNIGQGAQQAARIERAIGVRNTIHVVVAGKDLPPAYQVRYLPHKVLIAKDRAVISNSATTFDWSGLGQEVDRRFMPSFLTKLEGAMRAARNTEQILWAGNSRVHGELLSLTASVSNRANIPYRERSATTADLLPVAAQGIKIEGAVRATSEQLLAELSPWDLQRHAINAQEEQDLTQKRLLQQQLLQLQKQQQKQQLQPQSDQQMEQQQQNMLELNRSIRGRFFDNLPLQRQQLLLVRHLRSLLLVVRDSDSGERRMGLETEVWRGVIYLPLPGLAPGEIGSVGDAEKAKGPRRGRSTSKVMEGGVAVEVVVRAIQPHWTLLIDATAVIGGGADADQDPGDEQQGAQKGVRIPVGQLLLPDFEVAAMMVQADEEDRALVKRAKAKIEAEIAGMAAEEALTRELEAEKQRKLVEAMDDETRFYLEILGGGDEYDDYDDDDEEEEEEEEEAAAEVQQKEQQAVVEAEVAKEEVAKVHPGYGFLSEKQTTKEETTKEETTKEEAAKEETTKEETTKEETTKEEAAKEETTKEETTKEETTKEETTKEETTKEETTKEEVAKEEVSKEEGEATTPTLEAAREEQHMKMGDQIEEGMAKETKGEEEKEGEEQHGEEERQEAAQQQEQDAGDAANDVVAGDAAADGGDDVSSDAAPAAAAAAVAAAADGGEDVSGGTDGAAGAGAEAGAGTGGAAAGGTDGADGATGGADAADVADGAVDAEAAAATAADGAAAAATAAEALKKTEAAKAEAAKAEAAKAEAAKYDAAKAETTAACSSADAAAAAADLAAIGYGKSAGVAIAAALEEQLQEQREKSGEATSAAAAVALEASETAVVIVSTLTDPWIMMMQYKFQRAFAPRLHLVWKYDDEEGGGAKKSKSRAKPLPKKELRKRQLQFLVRGLASHTPTKVPTIAHIDDRMSAGLEAMLSSRDRLEVLVDEHHMQGEMIRERRIANGERPQTAEERTEEQRRLGIEKRREQLAYMEKANERRRLRRLEKEQEQQEEQRALAVYESKLRAVHADGKLEEVTMAVQRCCRHFFARAKLHMKKVGKANARGQLHPMPGTVSGQSGWYQAAEFCYNFKIGRDGSWKQREPPITQREWRTRAVRGLSAFLG
jgi:hypothetical protein